MPLVRIDVPAKIAAERRSAIGDIEGLRIDRSYLDIDRSASAFIISITLNVGRTVDQKKRFYADLTHRLETQIGVGPQDVMIVLTEVAKENWSFGNGEAQYA